MKKLLAALSALLLGVSLAGAQSPPTDDPVLVMVKRPPGDYLTDTRTGVCSGVDWTLSVWTQTLNEDTWKPVGLGDFQELGDHWVFMHQAHTLESGSGGASYHDNGGYNRWEPYWVLDVSESPPVPELRWEGTNPVDASSNWTSGQCAGKNGYWRTDVGVTETASFIHKLTDNAITWAFDETHEQELGGDWKLQFMERSVWEGTYGKAKKQGLDFEDGFLDGDEMDDNTTSGFQELTTPNVDAYLVQENESFSENGDFVGHLNPGTGRWIGWDFDAAEDGSLCPFRFKFRIRGEDVSDRSVAFGFTDGDANPSSTGNQACYIKMQDSDFQHYNGTAWADVTTGDVLSDNTWYDIEIVVDPVEDEYEFFIGTTSYGTFSFRNNQTKLDQFFMSLSLCSDDGNSDVFIDDLELWAEFTPDFTFASEDDFENYSVGEASAAGDWFEDSPSTNIFEIVSSPVQNGSRGMKVNNHGYHGMTYDHSQANVFRFGCSVRTDDAADTTGTPHFGFYDNDLTSGEKVLQFRISANDLQVYNGSGWDDVTDDNSFADDTWYGLQFEVSKTDETCNIFVNGDFKGEVDFHNSSQNYALFFIETISNTAADLYIDDVWQVNK